MDDTGSIETQVLLPTATVDLFIKDKKTAEAARALETDWRFARVTINIEEGDAETAIESYKEAASPSLVIIESETTDSSLTSKLEDLATYCAEGTSAIVIGPVNDVNLYRKLTSMGISDYLVRPVPQETLGEVIAKTLIDQLGATGSRLISVIGAKGGVGATAIAQAFALTLSDTLKQKTFLLDAAGGWGSLPVGLGYEPAGKMPEATRVAKNRDFDSLKRMVIKTNDKLSVLATGTDPMLGDSIDPEELESLIDMLMTGYPVVIVDLSMASPDVKKMVLAKTHEILLVTSPTLPALRAARTLIHETKVLHGGSLRGLDLIINMSGAFPSKEVPKGDIKTVLEREPSVIIPYDPKLFLGADTEGKKINEIKGGEAVIDLLSVLAGRIVKIDSEKSKSEKSGSDKGIFDQVLSKLKTK